MSESALASSSRPYPYRKCYQKLLHPPYLVSRIVSHEAGPTDRATGPSRARPAAVCTTLVRPDLCIDGCTVEQATLHFGSCQPAVNRHDGPVQARVAAASGHRRPGHMPCSAVSRYTKGIESGTVHGACRRASTSSAAKKWTCDEEIQMCATEMLLSQPTSVHPSSPF